MLFQNKLFELQNILFQNNNTIKIYFGIVNFGTLTYRMSSSETQSQQVLEPIVP